MDPFMHRKLMKIIMDINHLHTIIETYNIILTYNYSDAKQVFFRLVVYSYLKFSMKLFFKSKHWWLLPPPSLGR